MTSTVMGGLNLQPAADLGHTKPWSAAGPGAGWKPGSALERVEALHHVGPGGRIEVDDPDVVGGVDTHGGRRLQPRVVALGAVLGEELAGGREHPELEPGPKRHVRGSELLDDVDPAGVVAGEEDA